MAGTVSVNAVDVWPCESTFIVAFNVALNSMIAEAVICQSALLIASNALMEKPAVQAGSLRFKRSLKPLVLTLALTLPGQFLRGRTLMP